MADPTRQRIRPALKLATFLGFAGGFLFAYQRSSCEDRLNRFARPFCLTDFPSLLYQIVRFFGWTENEREQAKDYAELSQRAKEGKPLYGETDMPDYIQGVANRNSAFSQLKFGA